MVFAPPKKTRLLKARPGLISLSTSQTDAEWGGWSSVVHQVRAERQECGRDLFSVSGSVAGWHTLRQSQQISAYRNFCWWWSWRFQTNGEEFIEAEMLIVDIITGGLCTGADDNNSRLVTLSVWSCGLLVLSPLSSVPALRLSSRQLPLGCEPGTICERTNSQTQLGCSWK